MIRVVLDTNIFISFLLKSKESSIWKLYDIWEENKFINHISLYSLRELVDVLSRAKIQDRAGLEVEQIKQLLREVVDRSVLIKPLHQAKKVLQDEEDLVFLEIATTAQAQYVVSGDKGLLQLGEYQGRDNLPLIKIISIDQFLRLMEGGE
ncbi:MAG: PilT protein domain protein [Microgenomates bacterium 39_7]|nr:MAG: PilT protein domain protein [Microgenomates bacterium 39_7]